MNFAGQNKGRAADAARPIWSMPAVYQQEPTSCQREGASTGSQAAWEVCAWMHLYSLALYVTRAPTAYETLFGLHAAKPVQAPLDAAEVTLSAAPRAPRS